MAWICDDYDTVVGVGDDMKQILGGSMIEQQIHYQITRVPHNSLGFKHKAENQASNFWGR